MSTSMARTEWCSQCRANRPIETQVDSGDVFIRCKSCGNIRVTSIKATAERSKKVAEGRRKYNLASPPMRNRVE